MEVNDVLNFVNPYGFIKSEAVILEVERMGLDEELEANYRERLINRFVYSLKAVHWLTHKIWAADVPGVLRIYPYNDKEQPGGVLLYNREYLQFLMIEFLIELLKKVGERFALMILKPARQSANP